jgi:sugar lactone lactonase YvrE
MFRTSLACLVALGLPAFAQEKAPELFPPDAATLQRIESKLRELREAIEAVPPVTELPNVSLRADVEVYAKAAEWIVRHNEWLTKDSVKQTLAVLDAGLERAKHAKDRKTPWRDVRNKPIVRGYYSHLDGSVQPFSVTLPEGYGTENRSWRMDVVLHGRDATLTEVKFIAQREAAKPAAKRNDYVVVEPYGRGNNAYRWAGEVDVKEVGFARGSPARGHIDINKCVLRGFSMGGAGTWHIGLHHPFGWSVIGPGAGFTTTRGYVKNLPTPLPDYQEKCLRIYDAVGYAENAFHLPVVAYSGANDPQKAAADNIEAALKGFKERVSFTHVVAPSLEHKLPPEWQAKLETEYQKHLAKGWDRKPDHVRFVTYTPRYFDFEQGEVVAQERQYEKTIFESFKEGNKLRVKTVNVRAFLWTARPPAVIEIDGQPVKWAFFKDENGFEEPPLFVKENGQWVARDCEKWTERSVKHATSVRHSHGPIDDAFLNWFIVNAPSADPWHVATGAHHTASLDRFAREWSKYFRGDLKRYELKPTDLAPAPNLVLFGDPQSNLLIAKVLPQLPITWTKERLVVNGVTYDAATHVPVLIYPNPFFRSRYVVINSGHTFREADLKGTNALLYPRLGDWAVLKVAPTEKDPAAAEVVAAGLFDEFWQFPSFKAEGAKLDKLWGDGEFTEGPTPAPDGSIYFSDIGNRVMRFDPKTGKTTAVRDPGGRTNGLKFDAKGRLVACEGANTGGGRRISVTEKDGTVKTLADKFDGKRFNSPNDLTIDAKGRIYFTDPRYVGDEPRELDHESVYRVDPDGTVTRVISDVTKPNGIVLSPDGKTLYLSEHHPNGPRQLRAYPLKEDGTAGAGKVLHDFGQDRGIDGMTVAADGTIVATAGAKETAGIHFFSPDGKKVGFLPTPEDPNNCCFAGPKSKTLYITAGKSLYRVDLTLTAPK